MRLSEFSKKGLSTKKEKGPDQATPEWTEHRDQLGRTFPSLVKRRFELNERKKEIEGELGELSNQLLVLVRKIGDPSVMVEDLRVTYVSMTRSSIKKDKLSDNLLKMGLTIDQVVKAITDSSEETAVEFVKITGPRE
jgi:hypothetical protein